MQQGPVAPWKNTQLGCQRAARPATAKQSRLRIVLIDGSKGKRSNHAVIMQGGAVCVCVSVYVYLCVLCDCMACICSWYMLFLVCACVTLLVWVSEFWYAWLGKCRSGWEYKLGRHIKSSVSCWSSFTRGTAHSLYFSAFQLVYSGTCQASPPFEKPSACC